MGILKGTLPALLTPYNDDGSINEKEFIRYCEFGIFKGLNGLFCNGSAGDSQALSVEDQVKLMKLTKKAVKKYLLSRVLPRQFMRTLLFWRKKLMN